MMDPESESVKRAAFEALPTHELARQLAEVHLGDGDELGVLARVLFDRLERSGWTKDKPKTPGFYWFRSATENPTIVEVVQYRGGCWILEPNDDKGIEVPLYEGEWQGPLDPQP